MEGDTKITDKPFTKPGFYSLKRILKKKLCQFKFEKLVLGFVSNSELVAQKTLILEIRVNRVGTHLIL